MTIDINTLAADLAALTARVVVLEAALAAKTTAPKASAPRAKTAEQVVTLPAENCFSATSREGKLFSILGGGRDVTRGEIVEAIKAHPEITRISPAVYSYDFIVALNKKLAAKATPAPVAQPAPEVVPPVAPVVEAPVLTLPVDETPAVVNAEPAPVVDITPPAAPEAPKAARTRKGATK